MRMRDIINLLEAVRTTTAPLKDGTRVSITVEIDDDRLEVAAHVNGDEIGSATFYEIRTSEWDSNQGSWSSARTTVSPEWRRKGVATAMYDAVAKAGYRIIPSGRGYGGKLSPDGQSLWNSRIEWKKSRGSSLAAPVHPAYWKPKKR